MCVMTRLLVLAAFATGCSAPSAAREQLLDSKACGGCHDQHYREWSGSMHAYAARDPVFRAMNARGQRETNGALGDFCVKCHAPLAVSEKATTDGLNLDAVDEKLQGITCFFCHTVEAVDGTHNNPLRLSSDLSMKGPYADSVATPAHKSSYSALHDRDQLASAPLCGACHDVVTGHGATLERTFSEWQASVFAKAPGGSTCGQCHMPQGSARAPIANVAGLPERRRHGHHFAAVDVAFGDFPEKGEQRDELQRALDTTLALGLCVTQGRPRVQVLLDNIGAGHAFPSGASQDRRLWAEVTAYAQGAVVYSSGAIAAGESEKKPNDPDLWLIRDCIFDSEGVEVHDFWDAASYDSNALPAQKTLQKSDPAFFESHVVRAFPSSGQLPVEPDRVTLQMRLRPMSLDVLDELIAGGDLDPAVRAAMPTFDVGPKLEWTAATGRVVAQDQGFPVSCVSPSDFTLTSTVVPAPKHTRCAP